MRGDAWLLIAVIIFIVSLALQQVTLALVALLFLLTGGVARLWNRYCLSRIEYRRHLSRTQVFFGEEIVYEIEVANRKPLPLPWIQIEDELPERVTLLKGKVGRSVEERVILTNIFPLSMYHRVRRRFPMKCDQRGCFAFGPTHISSGDLFGFFRRDRYLTETDYLMVYPRLVEVDELGIPSRQLFGDIRLRSHLFRDPVLTAGVRDYHSGDSLKRIHWKSTARLGRLQTRVYEPTTTVDISIFLDVRTVRAPFWGSVLQLQELGIIATAAIARHALEAGFRVGLNVNQQTRFSEGLARVPSGQHPEQLERILKTLAQLHQMEAMSMARYIRREVGTIPWSSTLLVISAQAADDLVALLTDLKRVGRSVALVKVGGEAPPVSADNLPVYHISDDKAWEVVEEIGLKKV
jgi:uncharacterized protein (DUF58 family)